MADEKKSKETTSGAPSMKNAGERIAGIVAFLVVIALILYRLGGEGGVGAILPNMREWFITFLHENAFGRFLASVLFVLQFFGTYLALLLLIGIVYVLMKLTALNKEERHLYKKEESALAPAHGKAENQKWTRVTEHLSSDNPSDWRLAILEADIILEETLEKKGFLGQTLGEKLKNLNKGDFPDLDKAWEAHKIRNLIAHEGANFLISEREAKRVIELYKEVLRTEV
ncbi:MAG: hypothetical protein ABI430_04640 [Candidatus Taylorbacteria bacterium]